jgi:hypothetical protein
VDNRLDHALRYTSLTTRHLSMLSICSYSLSAVLPMYRSTLSTCRFLELVIMILSHTSIRLHWLYHVCWKLAETSLPSTSYIVGVICYMCVSCLGHCRLRRHSREYYNFSWLNRCPSFPHSRLPQRTKCIHRVSCCLNSSRRLSYEYTTEHGGTCPIRKHDPSRRRCLK